MLTSDRELESRIKGHESNIIVVFRDEAVLTVL